MRFKILVAAMLILLGIAFFSVYSDSNNKSTQDDKDIIQKMVINNSSFFEVSKTWNAFETVTIDVDKLRKTANKENSTQNLSEIDENDIFKEIKLDKSSIQAPESCDRFETVIVNPEKFRELASNGTVNLSLMGEDYELKLQEEETRKLNVNSYSGYIVEKPQSSAFFTVKNDSINGCINIDFYTLSYGIASTEERHDGRIVHLLWRCYNERGEEELKKHYPLDPLEFSMRNNDKKNHEISIELFDFYNKSVFKENYMLNKGDEIFSPEINVEPGYYRYEIILDNKPTAEQKVTANYATNLGGSQKLHLNIIDDPDNPIEFVSEIA